MSTTVGITFGMDLGGERLGVIETEFGFDNVADAFDFAARQAGCKLFEIMSHLLEAKINWSWTERNWNKDTPDKATLLLEYVAGATLEPYDTEDAYYVGSGINMNYKMPAEVNHQNAARRVAAKKGQKGQKA